MISAVRAAPKSGFLGVRLGCGDIHALKRCFILTIISLSLYSFGTLFEQTTDNLDLFQPRVAERGLS